MFGKCKCLSTAKISSLQICIKDKKKKKDIFDGSWMNLPSTLVKWSYDISMTWNRYWATYIICLIVAFSPHMNCLETIVLVFGPLDPLGILWVSFWFPLGVLLGPLGPFSFGPLGPLGLFVPLGPLGQWHLYFETPCIDSRPWIKSVGGG